MWALHSRRAMSGCPWTVSRRDHKSISLKPDSRKRCQRPNHYNLAQFWIDWCVLEVGPPSPVSLFLPDLWSCLCCSYISAHLSQGLWGRPVVCLQWAMDSDGESLSSVKPVRYRSSGLFPSSKPQRRRRPNVCQHCWFVQRSVVLWEVCCGYWSMLGYDVVREQNIIHLSINCLVNIFRMC